MDDSFDTIDRYVTLAERAMQLQSPFKDSVIRMLKTIEDKFIVRDVSLDFKIKMAHLDQECRIAPLDSVRCGANAALQSAITDESVLESRLSSIKKDCAG